MKEEFSRTALLLGEDGVNRLSQATVAVFGVGGVGSYCVEALARAGVGTLILFDNDRVAASNINRQLIALQSTIGMLKTEAAAQRIADINPECRVVQYPVFFLPENASEYDLSACSYIVDAVDTVAAKLSIIQLAIEQNKKICLTEPQIHAFLDYVCDMPADDVNKRRAIINIFVHSIYLYDDNFTLIINASKKPLSIDNIPLDDIEVAFSGDTYHSDECSSMKTSAPPEKSLCHF